MRYPGILALVMTTVATMVVTTAACGGDGGGGLDGYLPETPKPTGDAQSVWAGAITTANPEELIAGPAKSGLVGDFFIRNAKARYVIQAPTRVIGVVPQGGNLVDAVPLAADGTDAAVDHFGELSLVYLVGRTCEHDAIEIVQDGSGGGAAVVRATGMTAVNDFINLRGIGLINVPLDLDPVIEDGVECATTYILEPGSDHISVHFTLYNPTKINIKGPIGTLADTGGNTESWAPTRGFERLGISALTSAGDPAPVPYGLYQGPGVAYGVVPRHEDPATANSSFLIAGVSIVLFGAETLLDIVKPEAFALDLQAGKGVNFKVDIVVGRDASDVERAYRVGTEEATSELSGSVAWAGGGVPVGARVGVWEDKDGDGKVGADDVIRTYMDLDEDGNYAASVLPGNYLLRAGVRDVSRSDVLAVSVPAGGLTGQTLSLPDPVYYDYSITDDETGNNIPGKITIIGRHPALPDQGTFPTYDTMYGLVKMLRSIRGTTTDVGDGADQQFALPAGATYRILVSRGTEWSVAEQVVTPAAGDPVQTLQFTLRRVAPADGYVSSEYHVHSVGSPDSPVLLPDRVATMLADGVELFASTDHDYVGDFAQTITDMGVGEYVYNIPGIETTPFAYGHFNAWPIDADDTDASRGAIDWARGADGLALIPGEIFNQMRARGAEVVQINHPRTAPGDAFGFMQYFDRAALTFDYTTKSITGELFDMPVPNSFLRLPDVTLWDDSFNALEVWNGFTTGDTNEDGVREITRLDVVLRDWFNFLSFGLEITPLGNSDTHTIVKDPAGMPRTYVRVTDDSPTAIGNGNAASDVMDTLAGRNGTPRDVVVTNGPHIMVTANGDAAPLGKVIDASGGSVTLEIKVIAPMWAQFDTVEVFANNAPDVGSDVDETLLQPLACFTSRENSTVMANDPCALATLGGGAQDMTIEEIDVGGGFKRLEVTVTVTVSASDIVNRTGATGGDAWLVVRARGDRGIYPLLLNDALDNGNLDTFVSGTPAEIDALLQGTGIPAQAFTSPIYVDFDGGGYKAVFSP